MSAHEEIVEVRSADGTCWTHLCLVCGEEGCQDEAGEPQCPECDDEEGS